MLFSDLMGVKIASIAEKYRCQGRSQPGNEVYAKYGKGT